MVELIGDGDRGASVIGNGGRFEFAHDNAKELNEQPEEAGDGSGRSSKRDKERVQGQRESDDIEILKFVGGNANEMMDLSGDEQCDGSIEAMEQLMQVDRIAVASFTTKTMAARVESWRDNGCRPSPISGRQSSGFKFKKMHPHKRACLKNRAGLQG